MESHGSQTDPDRDFLINNSNYLGLSSLSQSAFQWKKTDGTTHVLTRMDRVAFESDIFSCVVRITERDFWFTACAMWSKPTEYTPTLADAKASCTGEAPPSNPFRDDFPHVIANLKSLVTKTGRKPAVRKGLLTTWTGKDPKIRIRHKLFTPTPENEEEDIQTNDMDVDFTLDNWPTTDPQARAALDEMRQSNSHIVNPIPAYGIRGLPISPSQYRARLQGAVVKIFFKINYWAIKEEDSFATDLISMRVLIDPPANRREKRKTFSLTDPMSEKSLGKKKKLGEDLGEHVGCASIEEDRDK